MKDEPLLTRNTFRESVFERDSHKCVICGEQAQDAHHILERRLFSDGGYYLSNGASLCGLHHIQAEQTVLTCETIREASGIKKIILPSNFYKDVRYDKWGNVYIRNGTQRCPGELFNDESVQKILNSVTQDVPFTYYVKYPRSWHLPWTGCMSKDDRVLDTLSFFNSQIVVSLKMDGENTTMYRDYLHARSVDGNSHWTQSWVRNLHATIQADIPEGWRICGENLFARHSIKYDNLQSYFYIFSIWNEKNECLSWNETEEWAQLLEVPLVPVIYKGHWTERPDLIHKAIWENKFDETSNEGYVIRDTGRFHYSQFSQKVGKYVRKNHVTTSSHWKFEKIEKNLLETV